MHLFIYELDNLGVVAVNVIFFVWAGAGGWVVLSKVRSINQSSCLTFEDMESFQGCSIECAVWCTQCIVYTEQYAEARVIERVERHVPCWIFAAPNTVCSKIFSILGCNSWRSWSLYAKGWPFLQLFWSDTLYTLLTLYMKYQLWRKRGRHLSYLLA